MTVTAHWRRSKIPVRDGVTSAAIDGSRARYGVKLPADFAEYRCAVDGTVIGESAGSSSAFSRSPRYGPLHLLWVTVLASFPRHGLPVRIVISFRLYAQFVALRIADERGFKRARLGLPRGLRASLEIEADSFRDFMTPYAKAPASIM